jgi:hypothetical protein
VTEEEVAITPVALTVGPPMIESVKRRLDAITGYGFAGDAADKSTHVFPRDGACQSCAPFFCLKWQPTPEAPACQAGVGLGAIAAVCEEHTLFHRAFTA